MTTRNRTGWFDMWWDNNGLVSCLCGHCGERIKVAECREHEGGCWA